LIDDVVLNFVSMHVCIPKHHLRAIVLHGCLLFIRGLFSGAPFVLGVPLFSSDIFLVSPFYFGVLLFSSDVFLVSPLHFGVPLFLLEVLLVGCLHFGVPFFHWRSFQPMSEGPDSAPPLMALLPGFEPPVEYEANLVGYFDSVIK
jgi:hypothetical protein